MSDIHITIIDRQGNSQEVLAPTDMNMNLMEVLKSHEYPVEGTCGGMALCASCQVYVKTDHPLPEISEDEEAMLAEAFHVEDNSRLGCQIFIASELDGMVVEIAPE